MRGSRQACVVVDGYSTANAMARCFAGYGLPTVHVRSRPELPDFLVKTHDPHAYLAEFTYQGDLDSLVRWLRECDVEPVCVAVGSETAVGLGDRLAQARGLPGNDPRTSSRRRDKHEMGRAASEAGVNTIPQLKTAEW